MESNHAPQLARALRWLAFVLALGFVTAAAFMPVYGFSRLEQARTDNRVVQQAAVLYMVHHEGRCPRDVATLVADGQLSRLSPSEDPWRGERWIRCVEGDEPIAGSAGPDGLPFTEDDPHTDRAPDWRMPTPPVDGLAGAPVVLLLTLVLVVFSLKKGSAALRWGKQRRTLCRALRRLGLPCETPAASAPRSVKARFGDIELSVAHRLWPTEKTVVKASLRVPEETLQSISPIGPGADLASAMAAAGRRYAFTADTDEGRATRAGTEDDPARLAAAVRAASLIAGGHPLSASPYR